MQKQNFILKDQESDQTVSGVIEIDNFSIYIHFDGYSTQGEVDGNGYPVMIELYEKELRTVVWKDINADNPVILSLEGARIEKRKA